MFYRGFIGSIEYSKKDECFHGMVLGITDLVTYEGANLDELLISFKRAVDLYKKFGGDWMNG